MSPISRVVSVVALLALAGCATNDASGYRQGPMLGAMTPSAGDTGTPMDNTDTTVANVPPPAQAVTSGIENLDVSGFVDPSAFRVMSDNSKSQASSAQYYALQFGRVGAARTWSGDNNVSGQVNVGPYVKVNNRDCRDFTNVVNVGSKSYTKRGTACRGDDGRWGVGVGSAPAATTPGSLPPAYAPGAG